ncbi:MAG TPA: methyltransferase domain-containing protein [Noviherbaspirillum sp.]|nr:methyltransferase domain-containing protein [Noviherbaspirillum sp.]
MKNTANAEAGVIAGDGFIDRLLTSQRRKLFDAFTVFIQGDAGDTVLNVGMMPSPQFDAVNYLEEWSSPQDRQRITSYEIAPPDYQGRLSARERQRQVDGLRLPFADGEFDWVFCDETIERVGSFERQYGLLKELARVARRGVFVTTSNRRHPLEFNTGLPLLHWLPGYWWRRSLKMLGKHAWAPRSALNLLDAQALYKLASLLPGKPKHDVGHKRVFGIKAHFFLMVEKNATSPAAVDKRPGAPAK